ncbi:hypothetical protein JXR93_06525 [bacterium]|nr:hypothetical protein [bacterium]
MYKRYILVASLLLLIPFFISSYTYNNGGEVFFKIDNGTDSKSYKSDSYISNQSNGEMLAYFDTVLDPFSSTRRVAIVEIYIDSSQLDVYKPDLRIRYMEKQKGKILFQASTDNSSVEINSAEVALDTDSNADGELTEFNLSFGFYVNAPTGRFFVTKGKITSTTISNDYQNSNTGNENYDEDDSVTVGCFSDPYEDDDDYEDDSSCAGDPSSSGVEDDNDSPSCSSSDSEYDDSSESSDCGSSDSDGDYDSSAESSSCGGDTEDDSDNSDSGDCSGDTVEASSNSFTIKREAKNLKRFQHFMTPVLFISLFVFYLRRKGEKKVNS